MESKLTKFSFWIFIIGAIVASYVLITSLLHTFSSKIVNPPPASQFLGPNAIK